jgi:hypothetical protein
VTAPPPNLHRLGSVPATARQVYLLTLERLEDLPRWFGLPCPGFVLLLAADATSVDGDDAHLAQRIVEAGCVYFCGWGPGSQTMHDLVDEAVLERGLFDDPEDTIATAWHGDASLSEAVTFALQAEPDESYRQGCDAVVLAVVANPAWVDEVVAVAQPLLR